MGLPLRDLALSLEKIPAVLEGINVQKIEEVYSSLGFPRGIEINYSLAQLKGILISTAPWEENTKNISVGRFDLFSIKVRRDSDLISYLELTPTQVMKAYLKKYGLMG